MKPPMQKIPIARAISIDVEIVREIIPLLSEDCAFDTDGSSITAADWVIVAGNAMNDIAIPVRTPYALNASKLLIPDTVSCAGINIASPL